MEISHPLDAPGIRAAITGLGISKQSISNWKYSGSVPAKHCVAIERVTFGQVTRKDLRPNDWHEIWPELAAAPANTAQAINVAG